VDGGRDLDVALEARMPARAQVPELTSRLFEIEGVREVLWS